MKNFTSTLDYKNKIETMTQEGFETSLVLKVECNWEHDDLNGTWCTERKTVVESSDVKEAFQSVTGLDGSCCAFTQSMSYYWLVRRVNGTMYPWPLLFVTQEEREESASRYNDETWRMFYAGNYDSAQLAKEIVDCPSEEEIQSLLNQVEQLTDLDGSQWDDLDQRGGLTPRWAA